MEYVIKVDEHYVLIEGFNIQYMSDPEKGTKFDSIRELAEKAEELQISGYEPQKV